MRVMGNRRWMVTQEWVALGAHALRIFRDLFTVRGARTVLVYAQILHWPLGRAHGDRERIRPVALELTLELVHDRRLHGGPVLSYVF